MLKKFGFTLAEVLITLAIIGVVAALTIPPMVNNIQEAELRHSWKKTYSTYVNATQKIMNDNGGSTLGVNGSDDTLRRMYEPYLNVVKICPDPGVLKGVCWHQDAGWFLLDNSPAVNSVAGIFIILQHGPGHVLADGTIARYTTYTGGFDCDNAHPLCGHILVDVNGFKKPNTVGHDIFGMYVYYNRLVPFGKPSNGEGSTCNPTDNGFACSAVYLYK